MWNSHADWLPIGFSTNPWSNLCNLKTFCSSAFSLLELVPIGPHVFYQLALIIGPHLLIEQENHLPSVNLWRREWHWHFFPFHQNLTFFIFHTWRNIKDALRRFEMSLSLLYPFYLENLFLTMSLDLKIMRCVACTLVLLQKYRFNRYKRFVPFLCPVCILFLFKGD